MSILTRSPEKSAGETPPARQAGRRRAAAAPNAAVNLLSPWVLDELRVRALRRRFVLGAIALLVAVAGTWGYLRLDLVRDRQDLRDDEAIGDGLQQQIGELADVKQYLANLNVRVTDVEDTMAAQVAYAEVLAALEGALPPGAAIENLEITPTQVRTDLDPAVAGATEVATCPGADPFGARPVVACVALIGVAASREDVSGLVEALSASPLFVEPFIAVTTSGQNEDGVDDGIHFEGTLGLDDKTYTGRFTDIDGSDADQDQTQKKASR